MKIKILVFLFSCTGVLVLVNACQSGEQLKYEHYFANGRRLYGQHCQNCHAADGKGLGALIPPLTDSTLLKKNKHQLACLIRNGMTGKVVVGGKEYEGNMPANADLTAIDLAELVTYITNSFGNSQGIYDVAQAEKDCPR